MRDKIVPIIIIALLAFCVAGFLYFFEQFETEVSAGFSTKAVQRPYLAAQQFLEQLGKDVDASEQSLNFDQLEATEMIIVSKVNSILVTSKQIDEAMEWMRSGGQMIVGVGAKSGDQDSLLNRVDLTAEDNGDTSFLENEINELLIDQLDKAKESADQNEDEQLAKDKLKEPDPYDKSGGNTFNLNFGDDEEKLKLWSPQSVILKHENLALAYNNPQDKDYEIISWSENDNGLHFIQFQIGEGVLSVVSTDRLWTNFRIDQMDNAYALTQLVGAAEKIQFFFNLQVPSIKELLMQYFPEALLLFMSGLLLWIWRGFIRTSLIRHDDLQGRRVLSEHLAATSELFIKHRCFDLLVTPIVDDIEARMTSLVGDYTNFTIEQKVEELAKHSGVDRSYVQDWYQSIQKVDHHDVFVRVVKIGKVFRSKI